MSKYDRMIIKGPHPTLRTICTPVQPGEDNSWLATLERVCRKVGGAAGLAAPQIGVTRRAFFTLVHQGNRGPIRGRLFINPEIVELSGEDEMVTGPEGCLSYPGIEVQVKRHDWVRLSWQDAVGGPRREDSFYGFQARVIQHEYDHLQGICRVGEAYKPVQPPAQARARAQAQAALQRAALSYPPTELQAS